MGTLCAARQSVQYEAVQKHSPVAQGICKSSMTWVCCTQLYNQRRKNNALYLLIAANAERQGFFSRTRLWSGDPLYINPFEDDVVYIHSKPMVHENQHRHEAADGFPKDENLRKYEDMQALHAIPVGMNCDADL